MKSVENILRIGFACIHHTTLSALHYAISTTISNQIQIVHEKLWEAIITALPIAANRWERRPQRNRMYTNLNKSNEWKITPGHSKIDWQISYDFVDHLYPSFTSLHLSIRFLWTCSRDARTHNGTGVLKALDECARETFAFHQYDSARATHPKGLHISTF